MNEVKTYISFIVLCGLLIGLLSFLYTPNATENGENNITVPLESQAINETEPETAPQQPENQETKDSSTQNQTDSIYGADEKQRKRIHFTKILLTKRKELDLLIEKKTRGTDEDGTINEEIQKVEDFIEMLSQKIQELQ